MKPHLSVLAIVLLFLTLHNANGMSSKRLCTPMKQSQKMIYEQVFGRDFLGCKLSSRQAFRAMRRIHWMIPAGEERLIGAGRRPGKVLGRLNTLGSRKEVTRARLGLKMAAVSVERRGRLRVDGNCVVVLPPDLVASILAKARNARDFNGSMCRRGVGKSVRLVTEETREVVRTIICIVGVVSSFFFQVVTLGLVEIVKEVVEFILVSIPCPSNTVRIVEQLL